MKTGYIKKFKDSFEAPLVIKIVLPLLLLPGCGAVIGISTQNGVDGWYQTLEKTAPNPPGWVFGAVWTVLYLMMGLSLGLLWQKSARVPVFIFQLFLSQLLLNYLWSYVFFQLHWLWLSSAWIAVLIGLVAPLIILIWKKSRFCSILLWPYLLWLGFAFYLSFGIAWLNT